MDEYKQTVAPGDISIELFSYYLVNEAKLKVELLIKLSQRTPSLLSQSFKHFTLINYNLRLVFTSKLLILTTLEL